jgi:hypothetical protein
MHGERPDFLVDRNCVELIETLLVGRFLEALPGREDRDVGNTVAPLARSIPAKGVGCLRREEVTCKLGAVTPGYRDDCCPIRHAGIGIVDNDRTTSRKGGVNQLFLASLRLPVIAHGILADVFVSPGKPFRVERRLAGAG